MITLWTKFQALDAEASRGLAQILLDVRASTATEPGYLSYEVFQSEEDNEIFFVQESWSAKADADRHVEALQARGIADKSSALLVHPQETVSISKL